MQASDIPLKIQVPFAASGDKVVIPVPSQIGITDGRASWTTGFVPLNAAPLSSGGVAPFETDFNGIFNQITAIQQWQCAGGYFKYDSAFSTAIGGYPKYAQIVGTSGITYLNLADNNITNPESSGSAWQPSEGSPSNFIGIETSTVLTSFHVGMIIANNMPGVTFTLPLASAVRIGSTIRIQPRNSCTVASPNGIVVGSMDLPSVSMGAGESCDFTSNGLIWYATGGSLFIGPIGVGQVWKNLVASRAVDTTYTNSTWRPIMVVAGVTTTSAAGTAIITVAGVTIGGSSNYNAGSPQSVASAIVPPGATYRVSTSAGTATLQSWTELR